MTNRIHFDKWTFYGHEYKGHVFIYVENVEETDKVEDGFKPRLVSGRWFAFGEHDDTGKYNEGTFKALEFRTYEGDTVITFDVDVPGDGVSKYGFTTARRVYDYSITNALFAAYVFGKN